MSLYGKLRDLKGAEHVFNGLSKHSVVCWTAIITAYFEWGLCEKALQLYRYMHEQRVSPDEQTLLIALQACGELAEKELGKLSEYQISLEIVQALHKDAFVKGYTSHSFNGSALVMVYGKRGAVLLYGGVKTFVFSTNIL